MRITYDPEVDAMYITFSDGPKDKQQEIGEDIILDMSVDGFVTGMEILDATRNYGRSILDFNLSLLNQPFTQDHHEYTAEEAAEILRVNKETILRKIRAGNLKATRVGKGYRIPGNELHRFMNP